MPSVNTAAAGTLNVTAYLGDTFSLTMTFTDDNSDPIDLSGTTITMELKNCPTAALTFSNAVGGGITIGGVGNNVLQFTKLISIPPGVYNYDLQIEFIDGTVRTYVKGSFTILDDITTNSTTTTTTTTL